MKRIIPVFLLSLAACSPSDPVVSEPSALPSQTASPTPQVSTAPSQVAPTSPPSVAATPPVTTSKPGSELVYSGTAYLKSLGIKEDGSYESHINFQGSATLFPDNKLQLRLSTECGESLRPEVDPIN